MKGAILTKGESYFTHLASIFNALGNTQKDYNWLITECECYPHSTELQERLCKGPCWLTGDELTSIVAKEDFQWVWAVLSGFPPNISFSEALNYALPRADGYTKFWQNPVSIQHPLAEIEIVAFDTSFTLLISRNDCIVERFLTAFPLSQDLETYNRM